MKKFSFLISMVVLFSLLSACASNESPPTSDTDNIAAMVAGTFSAIPTITSLPPETFTPEASSTPSIQCKGHLTGIILTMPNHSWSCSNFISDNEREGIEVSSQVFDVKVSYNIARGLFCEPNKQNEDCVVTPFYENSMVKLDLYTLSGESKEIFGHVQRNEGYILISIKYLNMETKELTKTEMDELFQFIDAITFENK